MLLAKRLVSDGSRFNNTTLVDLQKSSFSHMTKYGWIDPVVCETTSVPCSDSVELFEDDTTDIIIPMFLSPWCYMFFESPNFASILRQYIDIYDKTIIPMCCSHISNNWRIKDPIECPDPMDNLTEDEIVHPEFTFRVTRRSNQSCHGVWNSFNYPIVEATLFFGDLRNEIRMRLKIHGKTTNSTLRSFPITALLAYHMSNDASWMIVQRHSRLRLGRKMSSDAATEESLKLMYCLLSLRRVKELGKLGIRHNGIHLNSIQPYRCRDSVHDGIDVKLDRLVNSTDLLTLSFAIDDESLWNAAPEALQLWVKTNKQELTHWSQATIGKTADHWSLGITLCCFLKGAKLKDICAMHQLKPLHTCATENGWKIDPAKWVELLKPKLLLRGESSPTIDRAACILFETLVRSARHEREIDNAIYQMEKLGREIGIDI